MEPGFHKILFPFDFSDNCAGAAPFIKTLASQFSAHVTVISVMPPVWDLRGGDAAAFFADTKVLKSRLDAALDQELQGVPTERVAQYGDPASMITDYAHSHGFDLIMMPTHGLGPFRQLLLGSVTAKVLHDARCPVWTAPHVEDPEMREHKQIHTILCAVDELPKSVAVLQRAAGLAKVCGAKLYVVHAVPSVSDLPFFKSERDLQESAQRAAQAAIEDLVAEAGLDLQPVVRSGDPAAVVHDEALHHAADLVIIGRGVLSESFGRLRTQAMKIIQKSPCPVLSL